jgi:putative FmdB family regulatory protein
MPTYEYRCPKCGDFEIEQAMSENALSVCPTCGEVVKKLMPRKLFVSFKGPGFHVNDYPSDKRKRETAADAPAAAAAPSTKTADDSMSTTGAEKSPAAPAAPE